MTRRLLTLGGALLALAAAPASAITVETVRSPQGITAWLVEDHTQKVISLDFSIRGGAASDPADKVGLSSLATGLLDEGAGPYDSGQFQGKLDDLSAGISFSATADHLQGSLKTLSPYRDEIFQLLQLALTEPRFDEPAVERVRAQLDQLIDGQEQNPDGLATLNWFHAQFPDHPYGRSRYGTKESIAAITPADLKNFAKTRLGRDRLEIAVVGDITPADLTILLDRTFGALPATAVAQNPSDRAPADAGKIMLIKKPVPQSVIRFGEQGIDLHDRDIYAAMVVNYLLGGSPFTSRLGDEVREKRGLAYTIGTGTVHYDHADLLMGFVGTQNAKAAETVKIIRAEWAKMRDEVPDAKAVADAKTYLIGSYVLGLNSTGAIAERLLGLQQNGFPSDYITDRAKKVAVVTVDDVKRVAKRLLDPAKLSFVVVGNPEDLKPDAVVETE
ncbi:MAG: zinc protease [Aliidongia sp.]|jgi:zinc protease|nr:zinc protease [Aliidongia sp.]